MPHLRDNAYKPELFATATQSAYSVMLAPLLAYDNSVGLGSTNITSKGRAIYAMSLAKASASTQRALMLHLLVGISAQSTTRYENVDLIQQLLVSQKLEQVSSPSSTPAAPPRTPGSTPTPRSPRPPPTSAPPSGCPTAACPPCRA
ncbi:nitrate- and nitrite sensing domain-containing protein [Kitasatospora aburaviensis]